MKEMITRPQANMLILVLCGIGVVLALLGWKVFRSREATGYGVILILSEPLWFIYNVIEDAFGLDSIKALLINAALFIGIGLIGRVAWIKWVGKSFMDDDPEQGTGESEVDVMEDADAAAV
jgi:hypothetical protein